MPLNLELPSYISYFFLGNSIRVKNRASGWGETTLKNNIVWMIAHLYYPVFLNLCLSFVDHSAMVLKCGKYTSKKFCSMIGSSKVKNATSFQGFIAFRAVESL